MSEIIIQTNTDLPVYMILIVVSFVVGLVAASILMSWDQVPGFVIGSSVVLNALMIVFGGMLFSAISMGFKSCGLSSVGGAIGVFAAIFAIARIIPRYREHIFKAYSCIIPLMYSTSKLACHFTGCCYGREYSGVFCLHYEGISEKLPKCNVFPVQLCETILFAAIFAVGVYIVYVKKSKHGIFVVACMCGMGKFLLDYLRASHADGLLVPSLNQVMCLVIIVLGASLAYIESIRNFVIGVDNR